MATQQQVRWAQLRVGITVLAASVVLAVLIFFMSGTSGIFSRNINIISYFDNAGGLREGSTVRLEGVDIGHISDIRVIPSHNPSPVRITMKVNAKFMEDVRKDSQVAIATEGVLGGAFIDIDSTQAKAGVAQDKDVLPSKQTADLMDVVRASQGTLQNIDTLVKRVDRIVTTIENGQGSIGKLINDPALYDRLNKTLGDVQKMVGDISAGKGSIGKLIASDEIYDKANAAVDKLNKIVDEINSGTGTAGKFLKDPSLYNNANQTLAKANKLMDDINAGKGAIGKLAKDEEFAKKLDNTMSKVSALMDRMEAGEGSMGKLLKDPSLYNNADQMLVETRSLIKALREDPKKYLTIHFKVF